MSEGMYADTSRVAQIRYAYEWKGEALSSDAGAQKTASVSNASVSEADFRRVSVALGLGETIRTTPYDASVSAFESGVEVPTVSAETPESEAAYSDPNAYQLTAYSNQSAYWYSLLSNGSWVSEHTGPLPSEEESKTIAEAFFRDRGLLPNDATGPYIRNPEEVLAEISSEQDLSAPLFISVYYTRALDGRTVVDESGSPLPYLTLDIGAENKILSASGPFETNPNVTLADSAGVSAASAWSDLGANRWGPGRDSAEDANKTSSTVTISMDEMEPVYLAIPGLVEDENSYFESSYAFRGTLSSPAGDDPYAFSVVVPAVQESRYEKYLQSFDAATTEPLTGLDSEDQSTIVEPY
jgi:hypothetical protein